jgi:hypothetical protein
LRYKLAPTPEHRIECGHRDHADVNAEENSLRRWNTAYLPVERSRR